jgi:hypothetical protein
LPSSLPLSCKKNESLDAHGETSFDSDSGLGEDWRESCADLYERAADSTGELGDNNLFSSKRARMDSLICEGGVSMIGLLKETSSSGAQVSDWAFAFIRGEEAGVERAIAGEELAELGSADSFANIKSELLSS